MIPGCRALSLRRKKVIFMHAPSLQRFQGLLQIIDHVAHHKFATVLGVIAGLCLIWILNMAAEPPMFTSQSPAGSVTSAGIVRPLTRIDDPRYMHEYDIRAHYINTHLDRLRKGTQADRAYVVCYGYGLSQFGGIMELKISTIFEVGLEGPTHQLRKYQDLSRKNWLRINRDGSTARGFLPGPSPHGYGMELYNEQGWVIGYLGIEYQQEELSLQGINMPLLRQTAASMRVSLLQPLAHLRGE
jgi:hypothetical protein